MRKMIRKTTKIALSLLLAILFTFTPLTVLAVESGQEKSVEAPCVVHISWSEETTADGDGMAYSQKSNSDTYSLKVWYEGELASEDFISVSLEVAYASAPRGSVEIKSPTVTLSNDCKSTTVSVNVYGGFVDEVSGGLALGVKDESGRYHTPIFAVRIGGVSSNAKISPVNNTVFGRLPRNGSVVSVRTNSSFNFYETGEKLSDYHPGGYVYSEMAPDKSSAISNMPGHVEEADFWTGDPSTASASFSPRSLFSGGDFYHLYNYIGDEIVLYYYYNGRVADNKKISSADVKFELFHGKTSIDEVTVGDPGGGGKNLSGPDNGGASRDKVRYREADETAEERYMVAEDGDVTLVVTNYSSMGNRNLSNFTYTALATDNVAPKVINYRFSNGVHKNNDTVLLTITFSENVQLLDKNMKVKAAAGQGAEDVIIFDYLGGTLTNALVFGARLDEGKEYNCQELRITSFENGQVADLSWNRGNRNNMWDTPSGGYYSTPIASAPCTIDTREPSIVTSEMENKTVKKSHSVDVTVSSIPVGTELYYTWSQESNIESVQVFSKIALDVGSGDRATKIISKSDGSGAFYLHLKVTGKSQVTSTKTVGPFYFDNTAPELLSVTTDGAPYYEATHTFTFYVPTGETEAPPTNYYLHYRSMDGTKSGKVEVTDKVSSVGDNRKEVNVTHTLVGLEENSFGGYLIGFSAADRLGNAHTDEQVVWFGDMVMFDNRDKADMEIVTEADLSFLDRTVYYNVKESGEGKEITFELKDVSSTLELALVYKGGKLIYNGSWLDLTQEEQGIASIEYNQTEDGKWTVAIEANANAVGYYEFVFFNGEKHTKVMSVFFSGRDEVSFPENYVALTSPGRLLNNRVWQIATKFYYSYAIGQRRTYAVDKNPIFSSKEKAQEYVRYMEYQDVSVLYIGDESDPEMLAIINALNSDGLSVGYNKAKGQDDIVASGNQLWLRYKSTSWKPSGDLDSSDWVYYYYGNASSAQERVTVTNGTPDFPELLKNAIEENVQKIVGENGWTYLTRNNASTDELGQPTYDSTAIFLGEREYENSDVYEGKLVYTGDAHIYGERVEIDLDGVQAEVALLKHYKVTFGDSYGRLYYRLFGSEGDYGIATKGEDLADKISATGLYEIVEFGSGGYKSYYVYVDNSAPVVEYEYTRAGEGDTGYLDQLLNGTSIRASTVSLSKILSMDNYNGGLRAELDTQAYLYITNQKSGTQTHFFSLEELDSVGGVELEAGIYTIYVYDRLGNGYSINAKINSEEPRVTFDSKSGNHIRISVNRSSSEIEEGTFGVYRNAELLTNTVQGEYIFDQSGIYRVVFTDIYGNAVDTQELFERKTPELTFSYYDTEQGKYKTVVPSSSLPEEVSSAYVQIVGEGSYLVVSTTTLRLNWSAVYALDVVSGEPKITLPEYGDGYMFIDQAQSAWTIKVSYKKDPDSYVIVSCVPDNDPPEIELMAEVPEYHYLARYGKESVLFELVGTTQILLENGAVRPANSITVRWTDINPVYRVTIAKDGGEGIEIDPMTDGYVITEKGKYVVTVTDAVGNTEVKSFELADDFELEYYIDGKATEYKDNPLDYIVDGEYLDTQYAGGEIRLSTKEDSTFAFLYSDGTTTVIYGFQYSEDTVLLYALDFDYYENGNWGSTGGINLLSSFKLDKPVMSGSLFTNPFVMNYEYENGTFTAVLPECQAEYEFWQFRISDINDVKQRVVQIERSNSVPSVRVERPNGDEIKTVGSGFVGVNTQVLVDMDSVSDDVISILSYYSVILTTDFSNITPEELYANGTVAPIDKEGYYRLVVVNRYGNTQTIQFKISFGLTISVDVTYDSQLSRSFEIGQTGTYVYKTNNRADFSIWNTACTVTITKDGQKYDAEIKQGLEKLTFALTEVGEYIVTVIDDCGNVYIVSLSVKAPVTLQYNEEFLTGYSELALKRAEHYTNAPLSVVYEKISSAGIKTVWIINEADRENADIIYDVLSDSKTEHDEALFKNAVGKGGDGTYTVYFSDEYGNQTYVVVKISTREQLILKRVIQNSSAEEAYSLGDAISNGMWTNRTALFYDTAEQSSFKVNGEAASFENGVYRLDFPTSTPQGEEIYEIEYVDEYGNLYSFTLHLYKKVPEVKLNGGVTLIDVKGTVYVSGRLGYGWEDNKISATYQRDGAEPLEYESGQWLDGDGLYVIVFTDIAGNSTTRSVTIDTVVDYLLQTGDFDEVYDGISTDGAVAIKSPTEALTVVKVIKDGVEIAPDRHNFSEHGNYSVTVMDPIGNTKTVIFSIYRHAVKSFAYVAEKDYAINQLWRYSDGFKVSLAGDITVGEAGNQQYQFTSDGKYEVTLLHLPSGKYNTFEINIDNVAPSVTLVGAVNGGSTRQDVTLEGLSKGDRVQILKDGELVKDYISQGGSASGTVMSEAGEYTVLISDEAGNAVQYSFVREFTTNTASNIVIILLLVAVSVCGLVYLGFKTKTKIK